MWLGYFLRKNMLDENLIRLSYINKNLLPQYKAEREIEHYYLLDEEEIRK